MQVKGPSGEMVHGDLVTVEESIERFSEVRLSDGSTIKVKTSVLEAVRLHDRHDSNGNPVYRVKSVNSIVVSNAPEHLRKVAN